MLGKYMKIKQNDVAIVLRNAFILGSIYLSLNIILRWLRQPIFHGHGAYGWEEPSIADTVLVMGLCLIPVFALSAALYIILRTFVCKPIHWMFVAAIAYLAILCIELDMSWLQMSKRHVGVAEVSVFLDGFGQNFGVGRAAFLRFGILCVVHAVAIFLICWTSVRMPWFNRLLPRAVGIAFWVALGMASVVTVVLMGGARTNDKKQLAALTAAHPLRLQWTNALYMRFGSHGRFIRRINDDYSRIHAQPAVALGGGSLRLAGKPLESADYDVVVLILEGINKNYLDVLTSLDTVSASSIRAENHYSTGNATHYGILGLVFGEPILFYGKQPRRTSAFVDAFGAAGFVSKRFGEDISTFGDIDQYTRNFSRAPLNAPDDWSMLPAIRDFLADKAGRKLAVIYYEGTHWPYPHANKFQEFIPEVSADFDYSGWNIAASRPLIVNRYKNSLSELNEWLAEFLLLIDLDRTVLVVTSDHGQEMFEQGRLGHAGGLYQGQIQVPLFVRIPGGSAQIVRDVTSHADVLPAISGWLGLDSVLSAADAPAGEGGFAIAAHNNHTKTPVEWVFVDGNYKVFFGIGSAGEFRITGISDIDDHPVLSGAADPGTTLHRTLSAMKAAEGRFAPSPAWANGFMMKERTGPVDPNSQIESPRLQ